MPSGGKGAGSENDEGKGRPRHALPIPRIRVDIAQRERDAEVQRAQQTLVSSDSWAGGRLSARGLDALQQIRHAAQQHLTLRQDSGQLTGVDSPVRAPESPSPTSPRTRRGKARGRIRSPHTSPRSPLVHYRKTDREPERDQGPLKSSILPPTPNRIRGLPARSLRFQKKTAEPPVPMYETEVPPGRPITGLTPREKEESQGRRHLGGYVDVSRYRPQSSGSHNADPGEDMRSEGRAVCTISFPSSTSGLRHLPPPLDFLWVRLMRPATMLLSFQYDHGQRPDPALPESQISHAASSRLLAT